jgi:hypothetical protein
MEKSHENCWTFEKISSGQTLIMSQEKKACYYNDGVDQPTANKE